jgi:hypothetical protein
LREEADRNQAAEAEGGNTADTEVTADPRDADVQSARRSRVAGAGAV